MSKGDSKYELPKGWIKLKLSEATLINMGQSPPSHTYNTEKSGVRLSPSA
jgi:hypothetical protein